MNFNIHLINKEYYNFKEKNIPLKIFNYNSLLEILNFYKKFYCINVIGKSINGKKIFKISWGNGSKKIIIWSQMHGNETTGTKSLFDILNFFRKKNDLCSFLEKNISITFIPMLNPDGAEVFQRNNFLNIDLNRDARSLQSPEIKVLFNQVKNIKPNILFNLHDQRSIYNIENTNKPSVLSFLSPSENINKDITENRKICMGIISYIEKEIKKILPKKIGRYSDDFYPTATGDCFQQMGYPCVLFEAGYDNNDLYKEKSRKYNTLAIITGLYFFAIKNNLSKNYKNYFSIPNNGKQLLDIIYRNVKVVKNNFELIIDVGIVIQEKYNYNKKDIDFINIITNIGDLIEFYGRKEIDLKCKEYFNGKNFSYLKIGKEFKLN